MTIHQYNQQVKMHADDLYRFVLKNIRNQQDAEDIVQQSYEILWLKKEEVDLEKIKSYLFTVGYHKLVDALRKKKKTHLVESIPEKFGGSSETKNHDVKKAVNEALEKLPDLQKQLVLLKDYEGYSYEEIGNITKLSENQVKVYLFRARLQLKTSLIGLENHI